MRAVLIVSLAVLFGCSKQPQYNCIRCSVNSVVVKDTCGYDIDHIYRMGDGVLVSDTIGVMFCEYVY